MEEILGYCLICKDCVTEDEQFICRSNNIYHKLCLRRIKDYRDNWNNDEQSNFD